MHIILGALGLIVTILILLNRLSEVGIDIGWLDPFKWNRRRKWRQAYYTNPVFDIDDPMKSTAGLMYTMAKCSGDISREEKACILSIFKEVFKLSDTEATELLSNCSFYIKDENQIKDNLEKFIKPSINNFADEQKKSAYALIEKVAFCEGNPNEKQKEFLAQIKNIFTPRKETFKKW
ncbi:TerB family tellurite resistance protein [Desulfonema ishimotonii]|uniref:TerB family tellurite resistance protein n=1 Tax=Desulfonema ishimotonii TaxID=45657 RepID=A0A401FX79_9BACT|nr:TerB family tellurite resistance protein [Desulfonema ishimotonii]GBC61556.1 TerB family tellurite resistance protein [Desulfonema ishimotonii]